MTLLTTDASTRPSAGWQAQASTRRDAALRDRYLASALACVPRLLGAVDRNPYRPTYGCFDREFWHYRTSGFASQMYQEAVLPLALVYAHPLPANRWHGQARLAELALAGLEFCARSSHRDGSCDDYYPFERALGAAVFSLQAAARACQLLRLESPRVRDWLVKRARWVARQDESGRLANHQALAALGLTRVAQLTGDERFVQAARARLERVLSWQSDEGWFEEYGGADPGYQTVTIDCLAKIRRLTGEKSLDEPLRRAVAFARLFLHPDGSCGGPYGSRGTMHFYPHGFELLASDNAEAADMADGFLRALAAGTQAWFEDDRMYAHRLANLLEAYLDWSPKRPAPAAQPALAGNEATVYLPKAGLLVRRHDGGHTVVSAARGGAFKHFAAGRPCVTDAGLILETTDGRLAVSQCHGHGRRVDWNGRLTVSGPLNWVRFETASPLKLALFHAGMWLVGRWCRTLVRRLLQRRLITGRRACPVRLTRTVQFEPGDFERPAPGLVQDLVRVSDRIEIIDPALHVRRMHFSTDMEAAYVAASGVYQQSVLEPWTDLSEYVEELNRCRQVTIMREL